MKTNKVLVTDAVRTVKRTMPRFMSIIAIVALGISFFAGMNATAPDMLDTMKEYMVSSNAMDIQIISTAGLTDDDIRVIGSITGVEAAKGEKYFDGTVTANGNTINDIDGSEMTIRVISLDTTAAINNENGHSDPCYMNRPELLEGNWPTSPNQCVVDRSTLSTPEEFQIGTVISVSSDRADVTKSLKNTEYTIVGIIRTPLYISYERGNTNVGTGKLGTFCYVPAENFLIDYYTSVSIRLQKSADYEPYSEEYDEYVKPYTDYITSISADLLAPRVTTLRTEYTVKVADAEAEYAKTKQQVEKSIAEGEEQVKLILDMAENGDEQLAQYKEEYNQKSAEAEALLEESKLEHSEQYALWEQKMQQYNEAKAKIDQYANAESELANARTEWNVANLQVNSLLATVDQLENLLVTTRSAIDQFNATQDDGTQGMIDRLTQSGIVGPELDQIINAINRFTAVGTAEDMAAYMEPQLQTLEVKLAQTKEDLLQSQAVLAEKKAELDEAERLVAELKEIEAVLERTKAELDAAEKELTNAGYDIENGELEVLVQLSTLQNQIAIYETSVASAKERAGTVEAEFEKAKNEAYSKLEMARNQLDAAQQFLLGLDNAKWYVSNRNEALLGYDDYETTAKRTAAISLIFPWFFFLVSALVCLNTMTRMIEEDRTILGTFKALGMTDREIMSKYIIYAFMASGIGSVAGSILGFLFFPSAVTLAYRIIFDMPDVILSYRIGYALPGIAVAIGSTVFATYMTCRKSLKVLPSSLMRSKAPKGGKKVFLENFPAIWSKLGFTWKVTFRNVFRNMKRFVMATMAVCGCTALLLAGFGLNDSIDRTMQNQFINDDCVWSYDMQIVLNGSYDTTVTECEAYETVTSNALIGSALMTHMQVYDAASQDGKEVLESYLVVPENAGELGKYIRLTSRRSDETHQLTDNGAIITEKLSSTLNVKEGEWLNLVIDDSHSVRIPVAAVVENYAFHYIYLSKGLYTSIFGSAPSYNYITANFAVDNLTQEQKNNLATDLMGEYEISAVAYTSQIQNSFENIMDSISAIVLILIISAALLAFIVLYNLSIINITERIKEIATIKVLGFDNLEVSSYIFRENVILTIIGIVEGLICGVLLHKVVISVAEVDIIMFGRGISVNSFIYAAVLAFIFSMFVSLVLHRRLKKVDMVESLKSIE